jgi:iron complex transport system ATP-binding protein
VENNSTPDRGQPADAIDLRGLGLAARGSVDSAGVDWTVPAGACVAILGPNGSGKSTLARIIGTHIWPTEGTCCGAGP